MPMIMESPRLSSVIFMEEIDCWSIRKMPMKMESTRWSFAIIVDLVEEPI